MHFFPPIAQFRARRALEREEEEIVLTCVDGNIDFSVIPTAAHRAPLRPIVILSNETSSDTDKVIKIFAHLYF